jgi:hypothetical protein
MTNLLNRCRLLLAVVLLVMLNDSSLQAQQAPLTKLLDSFYMVKEPARRIDI